MKKMNLTGVLSVLVAVVAMMTPSAYAQTVVFSDPIEGGVGTGSFTGATVGSWGGGQTVYTDDDLSGASTPGPTTAADGDTYIERMRAGGSVPSGGFNSDGNGEAQGGGNGIDLDLTPNGGQPYDSGILDVQFKYWIPTGAVGDYNSILMSNSQGASKASPSQTLATTYIIATAGSAGNNWRDDVPTIGGAGAGSDVFRGQWTTFDLSLNLDTDSYTLTTTPTTGDPSVGTYDMVRDTSVSAMNWRGEAKGRGHYIDGPFTVTWIPEPTSLVLLTMASLGLLIVRRRR